MPSFLHKLETRQKPEPDFQNQQKPEPDLNPIKQNSNPPEPDLLEPAVSLIWIRSLIAFFLDLANHWFS